MARAKQQGRGRDWSSAELRFLRGNIATLSRAEIARRLGRSIVAVNTRARRLGLLARRFWTEREKRIVRQREAAGDTPAKILQRLPGRTLSGLHQLRVKLGLARRPSKLLSGLDQFIRERHAQQMSDAEIAAAWSELQSDPVARITVKCVWKRRQKLGLAPWGNSERRRRRVAEATRRQLERAGVPSLAALHRRVVQDRITAMGWPADLRWREAQILSLIWDRGPLTKREICEALGMPFRGARGTLKANDPGGTYMATLMRRGLLVSFRRAVRTGRRGGNVDVYSLALNIQRRKVI